MTRLDTYRSKRDFSVTPEPEAALAGIAAGQPLLRGSEARRRGGCITISGSNTAASCGPGP